MCVCVCVCVMGQWRWGGGRERGRNGSGWASKVEVINQDLLSLFPLNKIIRDKQVRLLHVRQVSGAEGHRGFDKYQATQQVNVSLFTAFSCLRDDSQGALRFAPDCPSVSLSVRSSHFTGIEFV